jgi:hypothetical protein
VAHRQRRLDRGLGFLGIWCQPNWYCGCQLHNSLGGGNDPQGGTEVVLIPLLETAPTPDPALDPDVPLDLDVALDPENAVLDP